MDRWDRAEVVGERLALTSFETRPASPMQTLCFLKYTGRGWDKIPRLEDYPDVDEVSVLALQGHRRLFLSSASNPTSSRASRLFAAQTRRPGTFS
jgi:hypothetical protein